MSRFYHHPLALLAAFTAATVTAGAIGSLAAGGHRIFFPALIVAALHAILLGLPLYLKLAPRMPATLWRAMAAGFVVGALPVLLLSLLIVPNSASIGDVTTARNGMHTAGGLLMIAGFAAAAGLPGSLGGLVFWVILKMTGGGDAVGEDPAGGSSRQAKPFLAVVIMAATIGAATGLVVATTPAPDTTCHNVFRDGRKSIDPEARLTLTVPMSDWRALAEIARAFAGDYGWSITEDVRPDEDFPWFQISLCNSQGTRIFLSRAFEDEISMAVSQPQGGLSWQSPMADLVDRLDRRWPGQIEFRGRTGEAVQAPSWYEREPKPLPPPPAPPS